MCKAQKEHCVLQYWKVFSNIECLKKLVNCTVIFVSVLLMHQLSLFLLEKMGSRCNICQKGRTAKVKQLAGSYSSFYWRSYWISVCGADAVASSAWYSLTALYIQPISLCVPSSLLVTCIFHKSSSCVKRTQSTQSCNSLLTALYRHITADVYARSLHKNSPHQTISL